MEVEIIVQPDGTIMLPRGNVIENKMLLDIYGDLVDRSMLESFFCATSESEILFGENHLCG